MRALSFCAWREGLSMLKVDMLSPRDRSPLRPPAAYCRQAVRVTRRDQVGSLVSSEGLPQPCQRERISVRNFSRSSGVIFFHFSSDGRCHLE